MVFNYVKDYYIEGADRYSDATEGRTRISELEMLYKALRLAKRKRTRKKKKKLPSVDCKPLKWKELNSFLYRPFKMHLKLICLGKFTA